MIKNDVKMKITHVIIIATALLIQRATSMWPPSYKINLTHEETFIISDGFDDEGDALFGDEDEMIKPKELEKYNLNSDSKKYSILHEMVLKNSNNQAKITEEKLYNTKLVQKPKEEMSEDVDEVPWESGFVNKNGEFKQANVYGGSKNLDGKEDKRREIPKNSETDYDYNLLKNEYLSNVASAENLNKTLHYVEKNEEDSFKDVVKGMVHNEARKNCTVEERKGIGYKAIKCIFQDLTKSHGSKSHRAALFRRIGTIILVWIFVYILVAIPCWCQKGWCCCCFQCQFCKPREKIDRAKKFLLDNPLGVYQTPDKKRIVYTPTNYEKYAQNRLEKALMKL